MIEARTAPVVSTKQPMIGKEQRNASFNRSQAERCRRLARAFTGQRPEVARALEELAEEFESRAGHADGAARACPDER